MSTLHWVKDAGSPNYTTNDGWRAVFAGTERGYPWYRTYAPNGVLYGVGGLPARVTPRVGVPLSADAASDLVWGLQHPEGK